MPRQQTIVVTSVVPGPPERAWSAMCDTSRYAQWVEGTIAVTRTDGPARLGSTYDELTRISGPWKASTHWRITEFDPPRRQVHAGDGVATASNMVLIIEFEPEGPVTRLTMTIQYTPRFGFVGALLDRAVVGKVKSAQQRSADAFAALVGGGGSTE